MSIDPRHSWSTPPRQLSLGKTDVHVWRASLEPVPEIVAQLRALLSPDECARAERFRFEIDRCHFIIARGILKTILGRYLEIAPAQIEFVYADRGKPRLADSIAQPALKFNLAHSGSLALYAFTRIGDVGVDIEHIRPELAGDDIARRFFSPHEIASLDQLPIHERQQAFFNCWTRKEAFIKAKGLGLSLPLDQFDVTLAPTETAALLRTRWDEDEAARWSLTALDAGAGYVAALAIEAKEWQLSCWHYD
jgi:4'-phosphopantetheinyl transferase